MCDIHNVESAQTNDGLDVVYDNMDTLTSELVRIYFNTYLIANPITKYTTLVLRIQHMRM